LLDLARRWWQALAGAAAVFLVAAVPFLLLYVPVLRQSGWRSFGDFCSKRTCNKPNARLRQAYPPILH
jgi:hypothetical protein